MRKKKKIKAETFLSFHWWVFLIGSISVLVGELFYILGCFGRAWGGVGINKNRATEWISGNRAAGLLWELSQRKSHSIRIRGLHFRLELISLLMLLHLLLVLGVTSSSSSLMLPIVDICKSVFITVVFYANWASPRWSLNSKEIQWICVEILDKLNLEYGFGYIAFLRHLIAKENICLYCDDMENRVEGHGNWFKNQLICMVSISIVVVWLNTGNWFCLCLLSMYIVEIGGCFCFNMWNWWIYWHKSLVLFGP